MEVPEIVYKKAEFIETVILYLNNHLTYLTPNTKRKTLFFVT